VYPGRQRSRETPPMTRFKDWVPEGVIPAVLLPFRTNFSIDEPAYRRQLRDVAAVRGVSAE